MSWFNQLPIIRYLSWIKHKWQLSKSANGLMIGLNSFAKNTKFGKNNRIGKNTNLNYCSLGDYSYVEKNSDLNFCSIGKFTSIGPNFKVGQGIHPTNFLSTHPNFYSKLPHVINPFSNIQRFQENRNTIIGNDVWIGANVLVNDGINIGNGAIIGAGAVVIKDVAPFSIVGGVPAKTLKKDLMKNLLREF